jgi:hypothetical protein
LSELAGLYLAWGRWSKAQACLAEAWNLVGERRALHFSSVQRELIERQQELHRLAGFELHNREVGVGEDPTPTSLD